MASQRAPLQIAVETATANKALQKKKKKERAANGTLEGTRVTLLYNCISLGPATKILFLLKCSWFTVLLIPVVQQSGLIIVVVQLLNNSCCLYPTVCDPMDCRTPGFPVLHSLSEFAQTRVH